MPASTVHAVLVRCRLDRLAHIDRTLAGGWAFNMVYTFENARVAA
jgi:hypothetical protein